MITVLYTFGFRTANNAVIDEIGQKKKSYPVNDKTNGNYSERARCTYLQVRSYDSYYTYYQKKIKNTLSIIGLLCIMLLQEMHKYTYERKT